MESQIGAVKGNLVGVYAANDGTAGGAIAALKGGGVNPLPPVTGQDAELAAIQRILAGDQAMTIYKAIKPRGRGRREGRPRPGQRPEADRRQPTTRASRHALDPVAVTKDNVKDTVVKDGFYKVSDICTAEYAAALRQAPASS